ncbi:hypothetical protein NSB25_27975 [Acetatifactor muris]|uniref:Uncharacterized protein n=1 Tax=Acetatifactor muris TaxID=879566 RepID=A0A2K4ZQI3_9FIRM|nr:hypothetical protein [Acetatifactor muris]MCR2051059.1 hypothetical protein [Acetatifactor muris]SOY32592.1 hypothetical protein AMURIS_05357 [Acetatifactor muris]
MMISKWDMKNYIKKNPDKFPYVYREEEDGLYDKETGEYLSSLDHFLELYRKNSGESFESVYYDDVGLQDFVRCTECGTVIFASEDDSYDPNLKCPTCTGYKTYFEYWTKEEINSDLQKQLEISRLEEMTKMQVEQNKRMKRRNGKYDWQIGSKKFRFKRYSISFELECDDATVSYLKGLRLNVNIWEKEKLDDICSYWLIGFTLPLSWHQFYIQFIYRHLEKCHPSIRSKWYIGKARD